MEAKSDAATLVSNTPNVPQGVVRPSTAADLPYVTAIYSRFVSTSTAAFEIVAPNEYECRAEDRPFWIAIAHIL
jgi:hypothetical protein